MQDIEQTQADSSNLIDSRRPPHAAITLAGALLFALLYPVSLVFSVGVDEWDLAIRWFQHTPVFSIFLLSAFPISVLLLVEVSSELNQRLTTRERRRDVVVLGLVLSVLTAATVANGFPNDPIPPHLLRGDAVREGHRLERLLRAAQFDTKQNTTDAYLAAVEDYKKLVGNGFGSIGRVFSQGSPAAWAMFLASVLGALVVPWLITIVVALVRNRGVGTTRHVDLVILASVFLLTFVPFRAYSDWYRDSLYGGDIIETMARYLILGLAALAIVGALVVQRRSTATKLAFGLLSSVAFGAITVAGLGFEQWSWLRHIAGAPPLQVFALYVLFAIVAYLYAVSVRDGALDTLSRE
jgi:hypothetical protein